MMDRERLAALEKKINRELSPKLEAMRLERGLTEDEVAKRFAIAAIVTTGSIEDRLQIIDRLQDVDTIPNSELSAILDRIERRQTAQGKRPQA